jgi:hypothetical protein
LLQRTPNKPRTKHDVFSLFLCKRALKYTQRNLLFDDISTQDLQHHLLLFHPRYSTSGNSERIEWGTNRKGRREMLDLIVKHISTFKVKYPPLPIQFFFRLPFINLWTSTSPASSSIVSIHHTVQCLSLIGLCQHTTRIGESHCSCYSFSHPCLAECLVTTTSTYSHARLDHTNHQQPPRSPRNTCHK